MTRGPTKPFMVPQFLSLLIFVSCFRYQHCRIPNVMILNYPTSSHHSSFYSMICSIETHVQIQCFVIVNYHRWFLTSLELTVFVCTIISNVINKIELAKEAHIISQHFFLSLTLGFQF